MFVSFNRNQQRSPLLRLPPELRDMIYRYVLDTAITRVLPPPGYDREESRHAVYAFNRNLRFLLRTPSILLVARQIYGEASAFQDQYIAVRLTVEPRHLLIQSAFHAIFPAIHLRASRFRAVQQLEVPQFVLETNAYFRIIDRRRNRNSNSPRVTQQDLPALETVVWTPGPFISQQEQEETVRYTFSRSGLRIVDREADVANDGAEDDDEWIDDEGESDEEDTKGKDDSGDYEDNSLDEDSP